jgi:predicted amidohydrolase
MSNREVTIAIGQMNVNQGETEENLKTMIDMSKKAKAQGADLICFPELSYTGYHLSSEELQQLAEPVDGRLFQELSTVAKSLGLYIIAGYAEAVEIPGRMYNSALFVDDQGQLIGNMRKVYAWGEEKLKFREGNQFPVYETPLGNIGLMICYDCEFPEPMRIMALKGAEIIIDCAVWSIPAEHRWDIDLSAGALYNVLYTVGANTVGHNTCGRSQIFDPQGRLVKAASSDEEELLIATIDLNKVIETRSKLPYLNDFKEDTFSMEALKKY